MKIDTISETLGYTIDTYGVFDPYDAISEEDWTDETEFDHESYVKDLAELMAEVLNGYSDKIFKRIQVKGSRSPREYNFATDNADLDVEFNATRLMSYINANKAEFEVYLRDTFTSYDGFWSFVGNNWDDFYKQMLNGDTVDHDRTYAIMLGWYMRRECLSRDEYINEVWEGLSEIAYNNASHLAEA